MPKRRVTQHRDQHAGAWFPHLGVCQSQLESTTSSALKQVQDSGEAQYIEDRLPPAYRTREQKTLNNTYPFSSHDNRHSLENVGEYFDLRMGRRKVEPERRQHNSQNFLRAPDSLPSSRDGFSIYQTSFVKHPNAESTFFRRYPKHHSEKWCNVNPITERDQTCSQTTHPEDIFVALTSHHQDLLSRAELLVTQVDDEINICVK